MKYSDVVLTRRAAMNFLARREHSFYDLKKKLINKYPEINTKIIEQTISKLKTENLQSDERFTQSLVRFRKNKGFGYKYIKALLISQRIELDIIEKYLHKDEHEWICLASKLFLKKLGRKGFLKFGSKSYRKITLYMSNRGFTPYEIHNAIRSNTRIIYS